jgi:hypothetical protein
MSRKNKIASSNTNGLSVKEVVLLSRGLRLINKIILSYIFLIIIFPLTGIYAQLEDREPFFLSELEPKETVLVGRLIRGSDDLMYNGAKTNEFSSVKGCNNYGGVLPNLKLKPRLFELSGEQVVIWGQMRKIDMAQLLKENPTSECVLNLSFARQYFFFLEAKKVEAAEFYEPDLPLKIKPDKPLIINMVIKNPFKQRISNIQFRVYSNNDVYQPFERWIDLAAGESKVIVVTLGLKKPKLAKEEGSVIKLILQGYAKKNKLNYLVLFRETIATYNTEGLLEER